MDILLISMIKNFMQIVKAQSWCQSCPECDEYIRIFEYFLSENIFGYSFVSKSIRMSHSDLYQILLRMNIQ